MATKIISNELFTMTKLVKNVNLDNDVITVFANVVLMYYMNINSRYIINKIAAVKINASEYLLITFTEYWGSVVKVPFIQFESHFIASRCVLLPPCIMTVYLERYWISAESRSEWKEKDRVCD